MRFYFWSGVIAILVGFMFCWAEISFEPWLLKRRPWIQLSLFAMLVVVLDSFLIGTVFPPVQLDVEAYVIKVPHLEGSVLAGIKWKEKQRDLRVWIRNSSASRYEKVDFVVDTDAYLEGVGQLQTLPRCTVALAREFEGHVTMTDSSGAQHLISPPLGQSLGIGYRVVCDQFPPKTAIQLVMATTSDGLHELPTTVKINGEYESAFRTRELARSVPVSVEVFGPNGDPAEPPVVDPRSVSRDKPFTQTLRYQFRFDESMSWTGLAKRTIELDLNGFCAYLTDLGFEMPAKFPMVKIAKFAAAESKSPDQFIVFPSFGPRDIDLTSITLDVSVVTNVGLAREALAEYLFSLYTASVNIKLGDWKFREEARPILATYFTWSYGGEKAGLYRPSPSVSLTNWTNSLWAMRTTFGKVYTDRAIYYALKYINQANWGDKANTAFDLYLFDFGIVQGEMKEGSKHINETVEILHKNGINVSYYQPK
jgi:hypothetical protein